MLCRSNSLFLRNKTKPFSQKHDPQAGLVFFGTKLTGTADLIIAPYSLRSWRSMRSGFGG